MRRHVACRHVMVPGADVMQARFALEAEKYARQTELTRRVQEWDDKIRPILEAEVDMAPALNVSNARAGHACAVQHQRLREGHHRGLPGGRSALHGVK